MEDIPEHLMEKMDDYEGEIEESIKEAEIAIEGSLNETEKQKRVEKINKDFENPLGDLISGE